MCMIILFFIKINLSNNIFLTLHISLFLGVRTIDCGKIRLLCIYTSFVPNY